MRKKLNYILILFSALILACGTKTGGRKLNNAQNDTAKTVSQVKPQPKVNFPTGKIIDTVRCTNNPALSYALLLPENYTPQKQFPIMYFFDPQGNGKYPLAQFKSLAEAFHIIFIGVYDSKNGMPFRQISQNVQQIMADANQKLSIDSRRIYTCGFSGGAKVASITAAFDNNIKGVIACGAGLPNLNQPLQNKFDYFSIAGVEGLNFSSVKSIDKQLAKLNFRHQFLPFVGKHEWPPLKKMKMAFIWHQLLAMKDNLIPRNDSLISTTKDIFLNKIKEDKAKNKPFKEYLAYKDLSNYLSELINVSKYQSKELELKNSMAVKEYLQKQQKLAQFEMQLDREYYQYFDSKPVEAWNGIVSSLNQKVKDSKDLQQKYMYQRVSGFLSLEGYEKSLHALQKNDLKNASRYIAIFTKVDPKNPDHSYLAATLAIQNGDKTTAINKLNEAIKLGYSKVHHFETDSLFSILKNDSEYNGIVAGMEKNAKKN